MPEFKNKLARHSEHVKNVNAHCTTEETTKQALILPLLDALGFSPYDPTKVKAEFGANLPGIKANERVDYALFVDGQPVMYIEAKSCTEKLSNHTGQLARYYAATPEVSVAAITNGLEWRFFSDQKHTNIMDTTPFLTVNFEGLSDSDIDKLTRFRYDQFNPDGLRSFAEEQTLLDTFTSIIEICLRDPDVDFVKFIASRTDSSVRLTPKQVEVFTPIVKQAVADAISKVVVGGLTAPVVVATPPSLQTEIPCSDSATIDPDNPKIVTTKAERQVHAFVQMILDGQVAPGDIVGKDTESYFTVLYKGKVNRWILRYVGDRMKPLVYFNGGVIEQYKDQITRMGLEIVSGDCVVLMKPEHLIKLSGIINASLSYCQDDANFKREGKKMAE